MRAALARQQAQEVPEDERWAVQVRLQLELSCVQAAPRPPGRRASLTTPCFLPAAPPLPHALTHLPLPSCLCQGTAARRYWSCPGNADLRVRGKNYLTVRPLQLPVLCWGHAALRHGRGSGDVALRMGSRVAHGRCSAWAAPAHTQVAPTEPGIRLCHCNLDFS